MSTIIKTDTPMIKATINDIDNLVPLYLSLNQYHYNNIDDYYKEYTKAKVIKLINRAIGSEKRDIYIAKSESTNVMGLVEIHFRSIEDDIELLDKEYIEIVSVIVNKDYRGKGIGTKLLDFVHNLAKDYDKQYLELKVYDFNDSAIKFYEKNGFKPFAYYYRREL